MPINTMNDLSTPSTPVSRDFGGSPSTPVNRSAVLPVGKDGKLTTQQIQWYVANYQSDGKEPMCDLNKRPFYSSVPCSDMYGAILVGTGYHIGDKPGSRETIAAIKKNDALNNSTPSVVDIGAEIGKQLKAELDNVRDFGERQVDKTTDVIQAVEIGGAILLAILAVNAIKR